MIQHLTQYDSIYNSGFTAAATQRRMDRLDTHGPFYKVHARWKLTLEGDRTGLIAEVTDYENPEYLPPDRRPWADGAFASKTERDEVMFATVRIKEWGYWGEEASGVHQVDVSLSVNPDGRATQGGTMYNTLLYPPRDLSLIAWQRSFQWALGRFFSERLEKVTHVKKSEDGRLHVTALGDLYKGLNGEWELEIDPEAAWIVRKARFHPKSKPDQIFAEVTNEGTVWSGPFCIPKEARVNFWGPIEDMEVVRKTQTQYFTIDPVVNKFDERLYKECRKMVILNDQPQLTVTDGRVTPPAITQPNLPDPEKLTPRTNFSLRGWLIIVNLVAVVGLLAALTLRGRRKNANKADIASTGGSESAIEDRLGT